MATNQSMKNRSWKITLQCNHVNSQSALCDLWHYKPYFPSRQTNCFKHLLIFHFGEVVKNKIKNVCPNPSFCCCWPVGVSDQVRVNQPHSHCHVESADPCEVQHLTADTGLTIRSSEAFCWSSKQQPWAYILTSLLHICLSGVIPPQITSSRRIQIGSGFSN